MGLLKIKVMKRNIFLIVLAAAMFVTGSASAQGNVAGYWFGGLLVERERVNPMDVFSLSQTQFNYGTARSMGMAGAFTSLGADMASMTLNPAGLGMYRHSELTITPLVTASRASNSAPANASNSSSRFALGSIGLVVNAYEGTGSVLSVNLGFGYNRIADYNYNYSFWQDGNGSTLGGVLATQLKESKGKIGINSNNRIADSFGNYDYGLSTELWGGVLGYKCGLLNCYGRDEWGRNIWGLDEYPMPFYTDQYASVESRGSAGEYTFSLGMNFNNKIYFGATVGIMRFNQKRTITYGENIYPDEGADPEALALEYFDYAQWSSMSGTGVNLKLGLTWRPTDALRLGIAFHTPTYYSMNFSYAAGMDSYANDGLYEDESTPRIDDNGPDAWEFASPARMLVGASYTFGSFAVVSVDYERDWYNGIRMKHMPYGFSKQYYDDYFRDAFKGSNTVRIGAEVKPAPRLSLRAGYGYSGSMLRGSETDDVLYMTPVIYQTNLWSLGLGYALSPRVSLDVAYQNVSSKTTDYSLFYALAYDSAGRVDLGASDYSGIFSTEFTRHNVALTLSVKF